MLTMMMPIMHRITGAALYLGTKLLVWYLYCARGRRVVLRAGWSVYGSALGLLSLFGFTWELFHHFLGGSRHLV
jgi:succinate dehydrogenase / fumarate reductase cytochrome b subunit